MRQTLILVAVTSLAAGLASSAEAQVRRNVRPPIAKYQPFINPSLYMLGPAGPEYGYFLGTQPAEQLRSNYYNFNRDVTDFEKNTNRELKNLGKSGTVEITRTIGTTGHPTSFKNTGTYFPTQR